MLAVEELLKQQCRPATVEILMIHGKMVAGKALAACAAVQADAEIRRLVIEAAYLHDIGVCKVQAPDIDCYGREPYIRHGVLGRELLEAKGLPLVSDLHWLILSIKNCRYHIVKWFPRPWPSGLSVMPTCFFPRILTGLKRKNLLRR